MPDPNLPSLGSPQLQAVARLSYGDAADSATARGRSLTAAMATALVVGNMVGSGIFLLPSSLAPFGAASLLGWALTIVGALLLAVTFVWLARAHPLPGGLYGYTRVAFGDFAAFLVAWSYWVSVWVTNAAITVAMVAYLSVLVPALETRPFLAAGMALAALWGLTAINLAGVREAGWLGLVLTVLKLVPIVALILWGCWHVEVANFVPFNPSGASLWHTTGASAALALWAMLGLESATIPTENVIDPARNVARATLVGTIFAGLVTVAACTIVMGLVPPAQLAGSNAPFADAARHLLGEAGATVMALAGALCCFGALNGWVLVQGQLPQAMARDRLFPTRAAHTNRRGAPAFALVLGSVLASALILANYARPLVAVFTFMALLATLASLVPYLFCTMAALLLLRGATVTALTPAVQSSSSLSATRFGASLAPAATLCFGASCS